MLRYGVCSWSLAVLLTLCAVPAALAQMRELRAVGIVATGPNDRCGDPIWTLSGVAPGPEAQGTFLGKVDPNPSAVIPIQLTAADCAGTGDAGAVLATNFDGPYGAVHGWSLPNLTLNNLALRQVPIPAGSGLRAPFPLPGLLPPNPLPATVAEPTDPITVASWSAASGDLEITCDDVAGTGFVAAEMRNLIPNRVYTMWGNWAAGGTITTAPIGGLPNTIVADENGDAQYCRALQFCPLDLAPDGSDLQYLSLVFHGDTVTYGVDPSDPFSTAAFTGFGGLPFVSTLPGGIVSFDQLGFRINATGGPDPGLNPPLLCATPVRAASIATRGIVMLCLLMAVGGYTLVQAPNWSRSPIGR